MFTGLFRRRENEFTSQTPLEALRHRQTDSLKSQNPSVVEIQKNIDYHLSVTAGQRNFTLMIYLPPQFPQYKPVVSVSPAVQHPWVNDQLNIVGCPELTNFSMHSDLGRIIQIIVEEFQKHPPIVLPSQTQLAQNSGSRSSTHLPYPVNPPNGAPHSNQAFTNAVYTPGSGKSILHLPFPQGSAYSYDVAPLPSSFPELKELSLRELQDLKEDEDKVHEFIEQMPIMQNLAKEKEDVGNVNEEIAKDNLSKQPIVEEHKKRLLEMIDTISGLRQQYENNSNRQQALSEQFSPSAIQENLKFAALQAEEESEAIAEGFLDGKSEIEEFVSKFMEKRTLVHCRRSKEEKLHHQLMELKKSGF